MEHILLVFAAAIAIFIDDFFIAVNYICSFMVAILLLKHCIWYRVHQYSESTLDDITAVVCRKIQTKHCVLWRCQHSISKRCGQGMVRHLSLCEQIFEKKSISIKSSSFFLLSFVYSYCVYIFLHILNFWAFLKG